MKPSHDRRDEVLAWLREAPIRNANDAAKHFGIPPGTIRSWKKRERDERPRGELTLLDRPAPQPAEPVEPPAGALLDKARLALAYRLERLAQPVNVAEESPADSARIVASLLERLPAIEGLEPIKKLDPTTDEGTKALIEALKAFPADVREVMRRALAS